MVDQSTEHEAVQKKRLLALVGALVVFIVAGACLYMIRQNQQANPSYTAVLPEVIDTTDQIDQVDTPAVTTVEGDAIKVVWQKPAKLDDLGLFAVSEGLPIDYYKVGTTVVGQDVFLVEISPEGPAFTSELFRLVKRSDGYYVIAKNTSALESYDPSFLKDVKIDSESQFTELLPDETIVKGSTKLVRSYEAEIESLSNFSTPEKIASTSWGDLFSTTQNALPDILANTIYYIQLVDGSKYVYESRPIFILDDGGMELAWSNAKGKAVRFSKVRYGGCGLGVGLIPSVRRVADTQGKVEVAKSTSGSIVYSLTDTANPLVKYMYEDVYKVGREDSDIQSVESFVENLGFVIWTDEFGSTIVFSNNEYLPNAECGKPVIYLYPESQTTVSVIVGAEVTKSEPAYGSGWRVVAEPNGTLHLGDAEYRSLFWEGLGFGSYPAITSGTVVERAHVETTIRQQLGHVGLNGQEIADFLEFWMPKMPSTKFVRLTWFQNPEMNQLAPLKVVPRPDTSIRIFLDFAGLDQRVNLPAQNLKHIDRVGFTLVEWGGLLQ